MKPAYFSAAFALALAALANPCMSDSMLRITCTGDDAGAEVYIDGKFKGECPVDIKVPEGTLKLRVQKAVDAEHEPRLFEQDIRMGDGVVKKLEAKLGAAQLNAEGKKREEERRAQMKAELKKQGIDSEWISADGKAFRDCPDCPEMVVLQKPFAMGKYEVTQGQWKAIMGNNPSRFSNCGDTCPVENVSWNDVQEFIQKLNAKTGRQYRLPTEAEWEYACHGGSQTEYCGGNNLDAVGWYDGNSGKQTHPAGQKQANGYGLYDMSGNVWEWMNDCWEGDCAKRVLRGGSWSNKPQHARAAYRGWDGTADRRSNDRGFRLARTLP